MSISDRLLSKIAVDGSTGCWNWTAGKFRTGYGQFRYGGKTCRAHRVSYEIHCGPIPDGDGYHGACVLHRCDNRACINPEHLFLGTQAENMADKVAKSRQPRVSHKGSSNGQAKLTNADVLAIRAADGASQRRLAAQFGVAQGRISAIRSGKSWKDL